MLIGGIIIAIALVLVLAAVLAMLSSVQFTFYWNRVGENDEMYVQVRALYGWIKYRFNVPAIQFNNLIDGLTFKINQADQNKMDITKKSKSRIDKEYIQDFYREGKDLLRHTQGLNAWFKRTLSAFRCTELKWSTGVGAGDAVRTAILSGTVWTLKSAVVGLLTKYVPLSAVPKLAVNPQYNRTAFQIEFVCVIQAKAAAIGLSGCRLIYRIIRTPGGLRAWFRLLRQVISGDETRAKRPEPAAT
ncbi:DUF2953 domain-containing protein [Paenibacillus chitinolyticus]|uniref:DUF2953 domain-containing protein n=1 Tax=Paenibacillus chitinolyticus TaxID=79263 RepID=UPI00386EEC10